MVGKRFDSRQQSWQVHWRCDGKHTLRVRVNALNGDHAASEQVAQQLQEHILCASDRSDPCAFKSRLVELIAAESVALAAGATAQPTAQPPAEFCGPCVSGVRRRDPVYVT